MDPNFPVESKRLDSLTYEERMAIIEVNYMKLRARSFGTIPEWEYSEETVFVFFWELFRFRDERNIFPFILLPIAK